MNGFFYIIYHTKEHNVCIKMIPHMCRFVLMSGCYEEFSVPTPHSRNAYFFIMWLHMIDQKPKFRQCYFLVNIKNMKLYTLRHILVPVSDRTGGGGQGTEGTTINLLDYLVYSDNQLVTMFSHIFPHNALLFIHLEDQLDNIDYASILY